MGGIKTNGMERSRAAAVKKICLENRPETINRACLLDAPGLHWEGAITSRILLTGIINSIERQVHDVLLFL